MTNSNINPLYKGRALTAIVADTETDIILDEGMVLIQKIQGSVFFQLSEDYTFSANKDIRSTAMPIMSGSSIDGIGREVAGDFCLPNAVYIPTDEELEWYEKQNTI